MTETNGAAGGGTGEAQASPAQAHGWQEAVVEAVTPLTARIKSFVLRPPVWHPFTAGQHLDIRLTAPGGYQAQRSYSVASAPEREGVYELAIEALDDGEVSPFFHEVAQPGDGIEMRGPFGGHFNWRAEDGGPVLLIGGGSGIVPLMSMARHRAARGSTVPMTLLYGARTLAEAAFADELRRLEEAGDGFGLFFALSREAAQRSQDISGRVDAAAIDRALGALGGQPRATYVCGSNRFVEAAAELLVGMGPPPATIRTERYGGA
jgi:ferredoxin-NADP reductase